MIRLNNCLFIRTCSIWNEEGVVAGRKCTLGAFNSRTPSALWVSCLARFARRCARFVQAPRSVRPSTQFGRLGSVCSVYSNVRPSVLPLNLKVEFILLSPSDASHRFVYLFTARAGMRMIFVDKHIRVSSIRMYLFLMRRFDQDMWIWRLKGESILNKLCFAVVFLL